MRGGRPPTAVDVGCPRARAGAPSWRDTQRLDRDFDRPAAHAGGERGLPSHALGLAGAGSFPTTPSNLAVSSSTGSERRGVFSPHNAKVKLRASP